MSMGSITLPLRATMAGLRRFSVDEYHRLTESGFLTEGDNLELLEGYLIYAIARTPAHDSILQRMNRLFVRIIPNGWDIRVRSAVTLSDSEPEPDLVAARGDDSSYTARHPGPDDLGLVVEVAEASVLSDRVDKGRIYARAGLAVYWIVNITDRQVEVYEQPSGPSGSPVYGTLHTYRPGDTVPFVLDGQTVAQLPVTDLLP
jgi:Uma2 family endonuclease